MKRKKQTLIVSLFFFLLGNVSLSSNAQTPSNEFEIGFQIQTQDTQIEEEIITSQQPSQREMTTPSLWWAVEKIDPLNGDLVTNWIAKKNQKVIDLIVNNRLWSTLDYLDKYSFVNQFGTVAREYEYNLQVISQEQDCLATYTCEFAMNTPQCKISFESLFN